MSSEYVPLHIDNITATCAVRAVFPQIRLVIIMRDKTDLLALRLMCHRQMVFLCHAACFTLAEIAQRKDDMRQFFLIQMVEHIGLILIMIHSPTQTINTFLIPIDACIVPRRDILCTDVFCRAEKPPELDVVIADNARIGRTPVEIRIEEIVNNGMLKGFGKIYDLMRYTEHIRHTPRILYTAQRIRLDHAGLIREPHGHAYNVISALQKQCCSE